MKLLSDDERILMTIADTIAERHAAGWLSTTRLVNKIRLRTDVFNALRSVANGRAALNAMEEGK